MKSLAAILAGTTLALSANAATLSYNFSNPLETTEISQTGNLGLFDSSLGTLTGARITVIGNAEMSFSGRNTSAQAQDATITSSVELFWDSSLNILDTFLTDTVLMLATSGSQSYAAGETKSFGLFNVTDSETDNLASILGGLQAAGGGSFAVTCASATGLTIQGGGGNMASSQSNSASCGASIEYTYDTKVTQVPEPGSMTLVGLALVGLGRFSRRRKAA